MTCWLIISVIVVMHIINIYSCSWHQAVTFNEQRNAIELQENRMEKWVSVLQLINIKSAFCKKNSMSQYSNCYWFWGVECVIGIGDWYGGLSCEIWSDVIRFDFRVFKIPANRISILCNVKIEHCSISSRIRFY